MTRMRRMLSPSRLAVLAAQLAILAVALLAWEYLPRVNWLRDHVSFLDPYFISSPTRVWEGLRDLVSGDEAAGRPRVWPYLRLTVQAALIGTGIGFAAGALAGLWLSNSPTLNRVLRPYIILLNAVPRITLIPIFVLMFGPTLTTSVVVAVFVVFFVVFFNAYEGGSTVPPQVLQNTRILGANGFQQMFYVRVRYVTAWSLAALPNAVSFGLVSVVTAEILTGTPGMGRLLLVAVTTLDSAMTFAIVAILSVVGLLLVGTTELLERRWLHWWNAGEGAGGTQ